jgi:hypothetical protein
MAELISARLMREADDTECNGFWCTLSMCFILLGYVGGAAGFISLIFIGVKNML